MSERTEKFASMKKKVNRKILLGVSAILICVLLIAITSFVPFIIDPSRWQTTEFLTDELIIAAIVIMSMVSAMFIGQAGNAQNEKSRIAKARTKFFETVEQIKNLNGFSQWVKKVLQPKDIQAIKERRMREVGIEDFSVLELEYSEIRSLLETPQKFNGRFYKGLSKKQIETIIEIKNGKQKVTLVDPSYYLSVKNLIDNKTITERSSKEGTKKAMYMSRSIIGRLLITIISAMIFASLVRDLSATSDIARSLQKFLSRVWSLVSSVFMGYILGTQINDIDAEYVEMRINVQKMFLQDKDFKPIDQQEEAKQEFIERVKKEQVLSLENNSNKIEMKS